MLDRLPLDVFVHLFKTVHPDERIVTAETLLALQNKNITAMIQHPDMLKIVFNKRGKRWRSFIKKPLLYRCIQCNAIRLFGIVYNPSIKLKGQVLILAAENNRPDIIDVLQRRFGATLEEHEFISYLLRHIPVVSYSAIHLYDAGYRIRFTHRNKKQHLPFDFVRFLRFNLQVQPNADIMLHLAAYTGKVQLFKYIVEQTQQELPFMVQECALLKQDTWAYSTLLGVYQLPVDRDVLTRFVYTSGGINPFHWDHSTLLYMFRLVMEQMNFEGHLQLFADMCQQTFGIQEYTSALNWVMPYLRIQDRTLSNFSKIAIQHQREDLLKYLLLHHGAHIDGLVLAETQWIKDQWVTDTISDSMLDVLCQTGVIIGFKQPTVLDRLIEWSSKRQRNRLLILFKYREVSHFIKQCLAFYSTIIDTDVGVTKPIVRPSSFIYNMILDAII